jgi:hypothetical protein
MSSRERADGEPAAHGPSAFGLLGRRDGGMVRLAEDGARRRGALTPASFTVEPASFTVENGQSYLDGVSCLAPAPGKPNWTDCTRRRAAVRMFIPSQLEKVLVPQEIL